MSYRLEYAKSDRSACNGPKSSCPSEDYNIAGELRLGVEVLNIHGIKWRHWYCTTPKVIENMKSDFSDPSEINGWQDLRPEDQERVQRAWEEGEIPENERPESTKEHAVANKRKHANTPVATETTAQDNKNKDKEEEAKKETHPKSAVKGTREKSGKQEVSIQEPATKKTRTIPEEPKVASFATRNKKVNLREKKSRGEPTRRSSRITANKKESVKEELEEPVATPNRKRTSTKATDVASKKAKKN